MAPPSFLWLQKIALKHRYRPPDRGSAKSTRFSQLNGKYYEFQNAQHTHTVTADKSYCARVVSLPRQHRGNTDRPQRVTHGMIKLKTKSSSPSQSRRSELGFLAFLIPLFVYLFCHVFMLFTVIFIFRSFKYSFVKHFVHAPCKKTLTASYNTNNASLKHSGSL